MSSEFVLAFMILVWLINATISMDSKLDRIIELLKEKENAQK